jgi:hypothetical protein
MTDPGFTALVGPHRREVQALPVLHGGARDLETWLRARRATPGDGDEMTRNFARGRRSRVPSFDHWQRRQPMARFGTNLKLIISAEHRARVHALFVDVLGAQAVHPRPDLDQFKTEDGGSVGVFYVAPGEALGPEDQRKGTWLEFRVDDPAATAGRLEASGVARVDYEDRTHAYFQVPGGPVFRLAP